MTHFEVLKKIGTVGILGPLRAHDQILFQIFLLLFNYIFIDTDDLWDDYFDFNPLNGHYLYPLFFQNIGVKEEKLVTFLAKNSLSATFLYVFVGLGS